MKVSFGKNFPKYFWEVGLLPDYSSNAEYISLEVSFSNTITPVSLLGDGLVRRNFFQHFFRCHLFFVLKLVGLRESIASIENPIYYLNDISFLKFPSF